MKIVQIGCNNGKDHLLDFTKQFSYEITQLILIDANADAIELCKQTYSEYNFCEFLVSAVTDFDTDFIDIHIPTTNSISEHVSVSFAHLTKHHHRDIRTVTVPAISINKLLEKYSLYDLDRLYIDAEGLDSLLIKALDLDMFKIKYIYYEHSHSDGPFKSNGKNYEECQQKLLRYGYDIKVSSGDTIACLT